MTGLLYAATLLLTLFLIRALQAKRKYRLLYLEAKAAAEGKAKVKADNLWTVAYKLGKQTRTVMAKGTNEGQAVAAFISMRVKHDSIDSVTKG